jgi:hypothetical protein
MDRSWSPSARAGFPFTSTIASPPALRHLSLASQSDGTHRHSRRN